MKSTAFVLENFKGEISRFIEWPTERLYVVQLNQSKRVVFVSQLDQLDKDDVKYKVLAEVAKKDVLKTPYLIEKMGYLKCADESTKLLAEVQLQPEDEETSRKFFKYSFISHVSLLLLLFLSAYVINRFFQSQPEPVVVQVFEQQRPEEFKTRKETVSASQKKIVRVKENNQKIANITKIAKNNSNRKQKNLNNKKITGRPGNDIGEQGALAVLGGYSKKFNGMGGLNTKSRSNNAGIGMGGVAARGGHERGLLGKGMVAAGIGDGSRLQGFGGTGASGLGGGQPGYGSQRIAGRSGSYFEPLGEESLIEGGLDQDQINAVIQRNIGQVIYCYEQGLQSKPNLSGRVAVKFVIAGTGSVSSAQIANTSLSSKQVESCIVSKLKGWRFPTPVGRVNVRVTYPFLLKRLSQG